jgi:hypothetical protein
MSQLDIKECCSGMRSMISDGTLYIDSMTNLGWIKSLKHDGTEELGNNPVVVNYNIIKYCPFCSSEIQKKTWNKLEEYKSTNK